jgi:hypothetical protein
VVQPGVSKELSVTHRALKGRHIPPGYTEAQIKRMLRLALISLLLCAPAHAQGSRVIDQRDIEVGDTLVCDTQEQAERYIAHFKGDAEAAARAVNREESDPSACGLMSAAFVRGPNVAAVSQGNLGFQVVRILVLGVAGPEGFRAVAPAPYFTVFGFTEYPV